MCCVSWVGSKMHKNWLHNYEFFLKFVVPIYSILSFVDRYSFRWWLWDNASSRLRERIGLYQPQTRNEWIHVLTWLAGAKRRKSLFKSKWHSIAKTRTKVEVLYGNCSAIPANKVNWPRWSYAREGEGIKYSGKPQYSNQCCLRTMSVHPTWMAIEISVVKLT